LALDHYAANRTGLLLVDPYNDLLSDGGKLWPQAKAVAEAVDLLTHLRALVEAARRAGIVVSTSRTGSGAQAITTDGVILALGRP
jgi:nicotinamidase-related amidase